MAEGTSRRGRGSPSRRGARAEPEPLRPPGGEGDGDPSRYIARLNRRTGKEIPGPIAPEDLLVHAHRDNNPVEVAAQFLASRAIQLTGAEEAVRDAVRALNALGAQLAETVGALTGSRRTRDVLKKVLGVVDRDYHFQFRPPTRLSEREVHEHVLRLQRDARAALQARGRRPRLKVLLTGATGFLGKEILAQAAADRRVEGVVSVVRPEVARDPGTGEVKEVASAAERGARLLKRLHIGGARARKFRFVEGDIEKPGLGLLPAERERLAREATHVIHCAASVSFDDSYENSYRANVLGCRNALEFSLGLQRAPGSPFVAHVATETSYIHGRRRRSIAQENALVFPRHFYNNFYELTKAMASIETDRFLVEEGLRVVQLLPSIVVGHSRTGNNRGDTKVVNAPVNAFGRAKQIIAQLAHKPLARARARVMARVAGAFPGDRSAELNLVPVDRVAAGILASLTAWEAIGNRIHLATDNRIRSEDMVRITREELEVPVRLVDPTIYRNLTLPLVAQMLTRVGEPRLAGALRKLGSIFGGYSEWGQPIHDVGNDVRILGLPLRRPDTRAAFRMLCRHNQYVQEFGSLRDADEIARREKVWAEAIAAMEFETGREAASLPAAEFREHLSVLVDLDSFRLRHGRPRRAAERRRA
jgi:nucleoside-diphosphate-sugar epimerase